MSGCQRYVGVDRKTTENGIGGITVRSHGGGLSLVTVVGVVSCVY
jgi:hypothetical protein